MNIIKNALEHYDNNRDKYDDFLKQIKYTRLDKTYTKDIERPIIHFYDKDKKEIFMSRYEEIGVYSGSSKIWAWSWAIPDATKNVTYLARKILNYGLDIEREGDLVDNLFLRTELITSRFRIDNIIQLDIHVAISSYITKMPMIIPCVISDDLETTYDKYMYPDDISVTLPNNIMFIFILDYKEFFNKK